MEADIEVGVGRAKRCEPVRGHDRRALCDAERAGQLERSLHEPFDIAVGRVVVVAADGVYQGDADHLAPIVEAARALEVLTEDLRTLALSDAGGLVLSLEHVDLAALAHDAVAAFQAQAAGVALTGGAGPERRAGRRRSGARPGRDRQPALQCAASHTAGRAIRIAVRPAGDRVEMTVSDTGEGIPSELLPRVFERFVRTPGSRGSGLGLAIARDVIAAHVRTIVRLRFPAA